jgi:hypothetical protein
MQPNSSDTHNISIPERIERVYVFLEQIAKNEAKSFSNSGRANLRRAQSELQRARLSLYDLAEETPFKNEGCSY